MVTRIAAAVLLLVACARPIAPVPGAAEARARRYALDIDDVRAAVQAELTDRYGGAELRALRRYVVAWPVCRDSDGDPCATWAHQAPIRSSNGHVGYLTSTTNNAYWHLELMAIVDGDDGDVTVRVVAGIGHPGRALVFASDPDAPAWLPHEADLVRVAIDKRLTAIATAR